MLDEIARSELGYVILLFALFIVPRVLQRWRLPSAVTAFALGAAAGPGLHLFGADTTLHLLATFGIVALFLFAGLEVDATELRRGSRTLLQHLGVRVVLLALSTYAVAQVFALPTRPAVLVALALLTPSTGFILDALQAFGLSAEEQFWVKTKAIGTELLALGILFVALQSTTVGRLTLATALLLTIITLLPWVFRVFATRIAPYAPRSEFAFLLMMALVTAYATRRLGVYYLVGAFLVGVAARRFRESMPAMASERTLHAVEVFASFFAPFYFFGAGVALRPEDLSLSSFGLGVAFFVVAVPLRLGTVSLLRAWTLGEKLRDAGRVAVPMLPTLVFTLVLAEILRDTFQVGDPIFGGLVFYAVLTTLAPGLLFGAPPPVFDAPELHDAPTRADALAAPAEARP